MFILTYFSREKNYIYKTVKTKKCFMVDFPPWKIKRLNLRFFYQSVFFTNNLGSIISMMEYFTPSLPNPEFLTPP
jgi:hypothetical protein